MLRFVLLTVTFLVFVGQMTGQSNTTASEFPTEITSSNDEAKAEVPEQWVKLKNVETRKRYWKRYETLEELALMSEGHIIVKTRDRRHSAFAIFIRDFLKAFAEGAAEEAVKFARDKITGGSNDDMPPSEDDLPNQGSIYDEGG